MVTWANEFDQKISNGSTEGLYSHGINTIQVNVGLVCNQECVHCHVASSPRRKEIMPWPIMEQIIDAAQKVNCEFVDITGGAPELNPNFTRFVITLREVGRTVQVRTNLTVLLEPDMESFPAFYRDHKIHLVASLPCYLEENVAKQRGVGVYEKSIKAIKILNDLGYGIDPDLPLNLVYNPIGPNLPPNQVSLEADYKRELGERYGITFTHLHTITNMPIGRFLADLRKQRKAEDYMNLLRDQFNPETVENLMCRHQLSVNWDGTLFDCDFNLALKWSVNHGAPNHIQDFDPTLLAHRRIVTGNHCFGCTAGCGSSCGGALASTET